MPISRRGFNIEKDPSKPTRSKRKWAPNWAGPYVVKRVFPGRALILTEMDGNDLPSPINSDVVKKYYA